jgi:hypothetical protein
MGNDDKHSNNITYANVLGLHHDWADAGLQCWWQCGYNESYNASVTRAKMHTQ